MQEDQNRDDGIGNKQTKIQESYRIDNEVQHVISRISIKRKKKIKMRKLQRKLYSRKFLKDSFKYTEAHVLLSR